MGISPPHPVQPDAGLVLIELGALQIALGGGGLLVGFYLLLVPEKGQPLLHQLVLRGQHHVGGSEEGIRPGGEDHNVLRPGGAAHPVLLLNLHPLDEVQPLQIVNEPLGVLGDFQHPLALIPADHGAVAPLADSVHHLFVGQDALAGGAPVDGHLLFVGKALFEELEENPLGPFVVGRVGGVNLPLPVEGKPQGAQLGLEVGDVLLGKFGGMDVVFDGVVFGGQAEGVPPHGIEDVVALHPALAGHDIQGGVGPGMAHMEPLAGGVGELHQGVVFGLCVVVGGGKAPVLVPPLLPFSFDGRKIVLQKSHPLI